jgi:protein SCO1/2
MNGTRLAHLCVLGALLGWPAHGPAAAHSGHAEPGVAGGVRYQRSVVRVDVPDVVLLDDTGRPVWLQELLEEEGPWMVNFVFTSCTTICPVMTSTFATARRELGAGVRMLSISIDPEHDTPARLAAYASAHRADGSWRFLTGSPAAVRRAQAAFGASRGDKASHVPLAFLRAEGSGLWLRIAGLPSGADLARELRGLSCDGPVRAASP